MNIWHEEDGCSDCHACHLEERTREPGCYYCEAEKCKECNGEGWDKNNAECIACTGLGHQPSDLELREWKRIIDKKNGTSSES